MGAAGRRAILTGAAATFGAVLMPVPVNGQALSDPASLKRGRNRPLHFRAWERYPASEIPGLNRFLDQNRDISIEWASVPFARYRERLIAEFTANTPLDVVQVPETEFAAWVDSEWLEPLDTIDGVRDIIRAATPAAQEAVTAADGRIYAIPLLSDAFGLAYDREALAAAGFERPARTLDELRLQMQAMKRAGIADFPLSLAMRRQPGQFWSLWATLYASGGDMFNTAGEPVFDRADNPLKAILEWYVAAINDWRIVGLDDLQRDWGVSRTGIRSGTIKVGYMAQFAMTEFNVQPDSAVTGRIRMALVPGLQPESKFSVGYAHSVGIARRSREKAVAWRVLDHFAGKGVDGTWRMTRERAMDQGGRCPYPRVYDDPELTALIDRITVGDKADFLRLSEIARTRQGLKAIWYPEWELFMMGQFQDALTRRISVDAAIRASANEARRLARRR